MHRPSPYPSRQALLALTIPAITNILTSRGWEPLAQFLGPRKIHRQRSPAHLARSPAFAFETQLGTIGRVSRRPRGRAVSQDASHFSIRTAKSDAVTTRAQRNCRRSRQLQRRALYSWSKQHLPSRVYPPCVRHGRVQDSSRRASRMSAMVPICTPTVGGWRWGCLGSPATARDPSRAFSRRLPSMRPCAARGADRWLGLAP